MAKNSLTLFFLPPVRQIADGIAIHKDSQRTTPTGMAMPQATQRYSEPLFLNQHNKLILCNPKSSFLFFKQPLSTTKKIKTFLPSRIPVYFLYLKFINGYAFVPLRSFCCKKG